jgi:hypothetical protein
MCLEKDDDDFVLLLDLACACSPLLALPGGWVESKKIQRLPLCRLPFDKGIRDYADAVACCM